MILRLDRKQCIGCSACATIYPQQWRMDEDGRILMVGGMEVAGMPDRFELEVYTGNDCGGTAADVCPVRAIRRVDDAKRGLVSVGEG